MDSFKKPYKVIINPKNILEVIYYGDQTAETINAVIEDSKPLAEKLKQNDIPVNIIFDFAKIGKTTLEANKRGLQGMGEIKFNRMAGINANPVIRFITNTIAKFSGKYNKTRHFKNREEAENWLLEKNNGKTYYEYL